MWIQVELNICRATICNGFWFALFNHKARRKSITSADMLERRCIKRVYSISHKRRMNYCAMDFGLLSSIMG
jgi:hypothetical protein